MILTLAVGVDPLIVMIVYAGSVAAALIGVTILAVKAYTRFQHKLIHYSKFLPKIIGVVLAVMTIGFALGIF
ncbi:MAG: hypothetical protein WD966_02240 [Nitrosopumilaceae archaeon]